MNVLRLAVLAIFAVAAVACAAEEPPPASEREEATEPKTAAPTGEPLDLGAAAVDRPGAWSFRAPSSSMRLAEAEVPGAGGPALLTVFFFGPGGGGGVEANLERWIAQMEAAEDGQPVRGGFESGPFTISTVTVEGTLQPSRMSGGPSEPVPGSRLMGAVIEGPGGPWFFKLVGPAETVTAAAGDFEAMLRSVRAS